MCLECLWEEELERKRKTESLNIEIMKRETKPDGKIGVIKNEQLLSHFFSPIRIMPNLFYGRKKYNKHLSLLKIFFSLSLLLNRFTREFSFFLVACVLCLRVLVFNLNDSIYNNLNFSMEYHRLIYCEERHPMWQWPSNKSNIKWCIYAWVCVSASLNEKEVTASAKK